MFNPVQSDQPSSRGIEADQCVFDDAKTSFNDLKSFVA